MHNTGNANIIKTERSEIEYIEYGIYRQSRIFNSLFSLEGQKFDLTE